MIGVGSEKLTIITRVFEQNPMVKTNYRHTPAQNKSKIISSEIRENDHGKSHSSFKKSAKKHRDR